MKSMYMFILIVLSAFIMAGCSTRNISIAKPFNEYNQTPGINLNKYKDIEKRSDKQNQNITVAVAISGGGHRAGNFGVGALMALENIECNNETYNVLKEVDYFSTVSGGGFAAGAYIASLYNFGAGDEYSFTENINNNVRDIQRNLERGYHGYLLEAFTKIKTLWLYDRGDYLEKEFDDKILGAAHRSGKKSITFGDMFIDIDSTESPYLPIWIANATVYENGSIFPFYPATFERYAITEYIHNVEHVIVKDDYTQVPLSIGLKASASFPVAVPATTLRSGWDTRNQYIHLFDGGLADNLGISTAVRILEKSKNKKKVLIVIDAYNGNTEPFSQNEGSPWALQIYQRATSISLDTWRIRHKWITSHMIQGMINGEESVDVIYLSFEQSDDNIKNLVKQIGTNFDINTGEQAALFEAAKQAVSYNSNDIIKSLFGKECS